MLELRQQHLIGGQWIDGDGAPVVSENPASGEVVWQGRGAGADTVDQAVAAARAAFADWRRLDFEARQAQVEAFVAVVRRREDELALALHQETGKPLWESRTEIATMVGKAAISITAYWQRTGASDSGTAVSNRLVHRPIGVFAVLGPYNFPGHLPNGHIIPALLAGNTVVFKPSELTPGFGELMLQCWLQAGLPPGVINLVQGGAETGQALVAAAVDGLLFTGSSRTGHAIHQAFAGHPEKILALEMGGNNPLVVDAVAAVDAAVYTIIQSAFLSAGQRCTCARRLILLRSEGNRLLLERLQQATAAIRVGSDDSCFMGPVISMAAAQRVLDFQQQLVAAGGAVLVPVQQTDPQRPFLQPGLIDVSAAGEVPDAECFGPLLQVLWVDDLDAAIAAANNTRYGLAAGLLGDSAAWQQFDRDIRAGIVNWNRPLTGASGAAPFGGVGASGNFRPGAFYAADYCAYPMASMLSPELELPAELAPGISL